MKQLIFLIIAVVLAIAATVLAFIFIVPEKRREKLNAFGKFLHDLCSFKFLVVEKILQALYIFSTAFVILFGVLQLFNVQRDYWTGASRWMGGTGLLCIIVGPIAVRLSYERMVVGLLGGQKVRAGLRPVGAGPGRAGRGGFAGPPRCGAAEKGSPAQGAAAPASGADPAAVPAAPVSVSTAAPAGAPAPASGAAAARLGGACPSRSVLS